MKFTLITTGGTIASTKTPHGLAPTLSGDALMRCPLMADFDHEIEVVNAFSLDSTDMTPPRWLSLARRVRECAASNAVVVLHGTDTLAWTAAALSYLLHDFGAPVVITGSMLPADDPDGDAADNVYAAFHFALQLAMYQRRGVSVAFCEKLMHGPRVAKLYSHSRDAFAAVNYPLLGEMRHKEDHKIAWLTPYAPTLLEKRPWGDNPEFDANIAIVPIFPGMRDIDAVVAARPSAVVLEGFGQGGIPSAYNLIDSVKRGIGSGIPFIMRTQCAFDGVDLSAYDVGRRAMDLGILSACMTREALAVKLMLLLPVFRGGASELAAQLSVNFCDE
ncbi:MAG: asparaginase [Synergistaceae bacterium]|jgi:L-asparaginase|nr:asparaginase [Synergistaceae bacterium]